MNILTAENVVPGLNVGIYNQRLNSSRAVLGVVKRVLKTKIVVAVDDGSTEVEFDAQGYEKKHARSVLVSFEDALEEARNNKEAREQKQARTQVKRDIESMLARFTNGAGDFVVDAALVAELQVMAERAEKLIK